MKSHPIDLQKATVRGQHLFASNDPQPDEPDISLEHDEDESQPRYCSYCTGGHNCPECSGWDD